MHPIVTTPLRSLAALGENGQLKKCGSAPPPRLDVPRISVSYPTLSSPGGSEIATQKMVAMADGAKAKARPATNTAQDGTAAKPCL